MKKLCTVYAGLVHCTGYVDVVRWDHGDAFPRLGACVGVDTETELITPERQAPDVVVLGVFDPESMTCYVVYWRDIPEFMRMLCARDISQRYFNLGFDEQVIDACAEDCPLLSAVDSGRVTDMQIRVHLNEIATIGYIRYNMHSLAGCTLELEKWQLDKGDGTEDSARLSFRRYNPDGTDYEITDEQAEYLPFDCIATWAIGEDVPSMPSEDVHTKGMVVLAHISANGIQVDRSVFEAMERKLTAARDKYRDELVAYGFPDPYETRSGTEVVRQFLMEQYGRLLASAGLENGLPSADGGIPAIPCMTCLRYAVLYIYAHAGEPGERRETAAHVKTVLESGRSSMRKAEQKFYDRLCDEEGLGEVEKIASSKAVAYPAFVACLMKAVADSEDSSPDTLPPFQELKDAADDILDAHPSWISDAAALGPRKFFQQHVKNVMSAHPGLELEKTEKSGDIKLTLKDMWRLQDAGVNDPFLESFTRFNHCVKMLSTYMNREMICADWRVRPRFTNLLRTGRTSCTRPNIQNLPSRDKEYPIKNIYSAYPGMVLCATDFSFVELVCLAESCIQRFGFSVMGDIINAGVDPHRWFAGVRAGIISGDTRFTKDPQEVLRVNEYLKEHVTKEQRQHAKAANFGLPGGMSARKFHVTCREQGIDLSLDEVTRLRDTWISTFREMEFHMRPSPAREPGELGVRCGYVPSDVRGRSSDDAEDDGGDYMARLVNGMVRNKCSYCAALNVQFQGLAAYGVKQAMWNLAMMGMLPRMVNMIHDEVLYNLYPDELDEFIPKVEKAMIAGMRMATPHVKAGVETSCCLHWDKNAAEFTSLEKDGDGNYIIEEPDFVKGLH